MNFSRRFFACCSALMLTTEGWKQWTLTYLLDGGSYNWWYFPFQLCSIPMYLCLLLAFSSPDSNASPMQKLLFRLRPWMLAFLMDFGLLGGVFAFFDTSGMHFDYLPLTIHSFAWHILLIVIGLAAGLCTETGRSARGFFYSASFYLLCCGIATALNLTCYHFGSINMFYISPYYPMTQRFFHLIADTAGNGAGIFSYLAASIAGAGCFHLAWNYLRKA